MRQGVIVSLPNEDRMDIRFDLDEFFGGLRSGQCFDVLAHGRWIPTRIEKNEHWYLIGIPIGNIVGLRVRIED